MSNKFLTGHILVHIRVPFQCRENAKWEIPTPEEIKRKTSAAVSIFEPPLLYINDNLINEFGLEWISYNSGHPICFDLNGHSCNYPPFYLNGQSCFFGLIYTESRLKSLTKTIEDKFVESECLPT